MQIDNTTDLNKPISTATQTALDTLTVNIDSAYALGIVANSIVIGAQTTATSTQTAVANLTGSTGYIGGLKLTGDITYNSGKPLTSQVATLNGYKTSGTFSSTTTFQTVYTIPTGTQGFITLKSQSTNTIIMAFL